MATLKKALKHLFFGPIGSAFWGLLALLLIMTLLPRTQIFASMSGYLGFHSLIELFCVIVAVLAALSIFNSYRTLSTQYLCVGALLVISAAMDSLHLLSMPGLPALFSPNTLNKAIYFWLVARLCVISALLLLSFSRLSDRPSCHPRTILALFTLAALTIGGAVLGSETALPAFYLSDSGLTDLKIACEWVLVLSSVLAGILLLRSSRLRQRHDREMLTVAAWVTGLAEICFTLYSSANDEFNVLGHLYKAVSYAFIFRALFLSHLRYPWQAIREAQSGFSFQEQRWNLALIGSGTGVWDMDLEEDRIFASEQLHQMLGYSSGTLPCSVSTWREHLIHPDDSTRVMASFDAHVEGVHHHWRCEYRLLDAKNRWRWVLSNGQIMAFDNDQRPTRVVGTTIDIQARREQEQQLAEVQKRLQTLFDTAPIGMVVIDPEGVLKQYNGMFDQLLTPHDLSLKGERIWQWVAAAERDEALGHWLQWQQQPPEARRERAWHRELRMQLPDIPGQTLWTEWVITDLPEEHLYLLLIEDISARKRTTELLIENAGLYRSTFESGNAIKLLIDPDTGQIVDANMAASHYYGYALDILKSLSMDQISLTPLATRRERARETVERQDGHFETRHRLADGSERDVEVFVAAVIIGGRTLIYEMVHDITARKEAESALKRINQRLEDHSRQRQHLNELSTHLSELASVADIVPLLERELPQCFPDANGELALRLEELQKPHSIRWGAPLSRTPRFEYRHRLVTANGALGRITLQGTPVDAEDRHRMERIIDETARIITLTLINLRLRRQLTDHAYRDSLTSLYNRRYLSENLPRLLEASSRDAPLSLALLDLDHFKRLNDTWGHDVGDQVLVALGAILTHSLRATDLSCRYGGEEFIIVMPGASAEIAMMRLNDVLQQFGQWTAKVGDQQIAQLTFSAGLIEAPRQGYTTNALIEMADQALYSAKHAGRGRVHQYDHALPMT